MVTCENYGMIRYLKRILLILAIATLLFVWGNSLLPADMSSLESSRVERWLAPVLNYLQSESFQKTLMALAARVPDALSGVVDFLHETLDKVLALGPTVIVRKAAHFSEYMLLGFLITLSFAERNRWGRYFLMELCCLAVAIIDEGIQLFSDGRSAQIRDVCIDLSGSTLGIFLAFILLLLFWGIAAVIRNIKKHI